MVYKPEGKNRNVLLDILIIATLAFTTMDGTRKLAFATMGGARKLPGPTFVAVCLISS